MFEAQSSPIVIIFLEKIDLQVTRFVVTFLISKRKNIIFETLTANE